MKSSLAAFLAAVGLASALTACGDPLRPEPQYAVQIDTLTLYAMSGTSPSLPSAVQLLDVNLLLPRAVRIQTNTVFDFAVDTAQGKVRLLPFKLVVNPSGTSAPVGLQVAPGTFEGLTEAPRGGYNFDSVTVVTVPGVVAIESYQAGTQICSPYQTFSRQVYGKIAVDSMHPSTGAIFVRVAVDPNCGFRSLVPGQVPKS